MNVEFNVKDLVYTGAIIGLGYFLKKTDKKLETVDRNSFGAFKDFKGQYYREIDSIWKQINILRSKEANK